MPYYSPTGSGKTYLAKSIAKIMDVPFVSVDATTFMESGYKGRDAHDIIFDILDMAKTRSDALDAVVFVDEFDKLAARGGNERQAYQRGTQHSFLTLLEGGKISVERRNDTAELDVSGLLFIFAGAFTTLPDVIAARALGDRPYQIGFGREIKGASKPDTGEWLARAVPEDFVRYGIEAELMGRIPVLAPFLPLTVADLLHILTDAEGSVSAQYTAFFKRLGKDFLLETAAAEELAHIAHHAGTGARGLRGKLEQIITDILFDLPAESAVHITKEMLQHDYTASPKSP